MTERDSQEKNVFQNTQPSLDDEDDLIKALEDEEDDSSIKAFREQRIQQLHKEYSLAKERLSTGYGSFIEITEEKNLMDLITKTPNIVAHFAKDDFARCNIMDTHLNKLAIKHYYDTRFVKINVEKCPFLVMKLGIKILPCVICWENGIIVGRIVGFEGLRKRGYTQEEEDKFTTEDLEARLLLMGVIKKRSEFIKLSNSGNKEDGYYCSKNEEEVLDDDDDDDDDDDW